MTLARASWCILISSSCSSSLPSANSSSLRSLSSGSEFGKFFTYVLAEVDGELAHLARLGRHLTASFLVLHILRLLTVADHPVALHRLRVLHLVGPWEVRVRCLPPICSSCSGSSPNCCSCIWYSAMLKFYLSYVFEPLQFKDLWVQ